MCVNIISPQHTASCRQSVQGGISCRYRPIAVGRLIDAPQRLPPEKTSIRAPRTTKTEIIEKTTYSIQCGSQLLWLFLFFSKHFMFGEKRGVLVELVLWYSYFCLLSCSTMNLYYNEWLWGTPYIIFVLWLRVRESTRFIFYIILLCNKNRWW